MPIERYYLGAPIWSFKRWAGSLFTRKAESIDFLKQYASVFNTVEGNTTFYAVPSVETVDRWRDDTPDGFHFCFKFPRHISHDRRLRNTWDETTAFIERMAAMGSRLGPFLLQLPPSFGPDDLPILTAFLDRLPFQHNYVVEVRHPAFFAGGDPEQSLNAILGVRGIDRAIFDTRALREADPADKAVAEHQRQRPNLPVRFHATGLRPFYRYVGHPVLAENLPYLNELADAVVRWIGDGCTPYVFMHSPYDDLVPHQARLFHQLLSQRLPVGAMPPWPGEEEGPEVEQLSLL